MNDLYYSERQEGEIERERQDISGSFWGGFVSFIESRSRDGWFAERYPIHCFEAPLPIETDYVSLGQAFCAHNPRISWPLDSQIIPSMLYVLDAVEFFGRIVTMPTRRVYHDYGPHNHITNFDRAQGFEEYQSEVNTMLRRGGHPFEMDSSGRIQRLGPPVLRETLASAVFSCGDLELDRLLETARRKFQDPNLIIRTEAIEKLWDAWERLKTVLPGDKKASVKALLDAAVPEPTLRARVEGEARELTDIGNNFMIRHSETDRVPIKESEHIDYLFHRMFALILMILRVWRKKGF